MSTRFPHGSTKRAVPPELAELPVHWTHSVPTYAFTHGAKALYVNTDWYNSLPIEYQSIVVRSVLRELFFYQQTGRFLFPDRVAAEYLLVERAPQDIQGVPIP